MTSSSRAHLLARQIVLVVGGKVRPSGAATNELPPASPFEVKASMYGAMLRFEVFDGGCTIIGPVADRRTPPLALNHPLWRLTEKVAGRFSTPAFRLPAPPMALCRRCSAMLYTFVCAACRVSASLVQSH